MAMERAKLGLDQPLWKQFVDWMWGLARLDLGLSMWTGAPITQEIKLRFALSLQVAIMASIVATLLAIPLGIVAALRQDTWVDYAVRVFSIAGLATPSFWLGIVMILGFLIIFRWLPPMVYTPFWVNPWQNLAQLIWPALAVGYRYSAVATRMTRSAMLEVLREDYIRTARAKGLWTKLILTRHALKNALLPVVTVIGLEFAFLLGGLVVTEQVFNLNGLGLLFVEAIARRDYTLTQALVLLVSSAFIVVNFLMDVMYALINQQFFLAMRQDATLSFVEPRSARAEHSVDHLPGVMDIEPMRTVPVRLRAGHRSRTLAITGLPESPHLNRVVDRDGRAQSLPANGLVMSKMLGDILAVAAGDLLQVEVLEGMRPVRLLPVTALVDDSLGLQAYMRLDAVHALLREGDTITGAAVTLDPAETDRFYREVKLMPAVAGVALREMTLQNFRETMAESMNMTIFINVIFAGIIAFGVVYNAARVSLSERSRELASLRVLGFTRGEISLILLGELALLTVLALPVGAVIGYLFGLLIMSGFNNEIYRLSFNVSAATVAWSFLTIIAAAFLSGLVVRQRLDRLDLVAVLKARE
jgi:peptide/nickel transport system permease protein